MKLSWGALAFSVVMMGCAGTKSPTARLMPAVEPAYDVLVFSKTEGYRHASIEAGVAAIEQLGSENGFSVTATEDAAVFTTAQLANYEAVVFLNTSGDFLNETQQAAFEAYIQQGGGFVGIHGAAAGEYDWTWYGDLVGAFFEDHPEPQEAEVLVLDKVHPSTSHLPARWTRFDEWYNYRSNPRSTVHVLAVLSELSYDGGTMGTDHPIAWTHEFDGGRSWYTGLGHTEASYADPLFLEHVHGGIAWAAGAIDADAGATITNHFERVVLADKLVDPIEIAVTSNGSVFITERFGAIKFWDAETEGTRQVGWLHVNRTIEDGLMGITLDPKFDANGWLYMYYSPADFGPQRLSRFTFRDGSIDMESEIQMLEVEVQREVCCHTGGSLTFDADGHLYLSTGDNSNPLPAIASPIDNRPGHHYGDARRSSGNANDLRGKILRITPQPDGSYTIPEGNLFTDPSEGRPEVYVMGNRNPYRIAIDSKTGWLYWGDVGQGAPPNPDRGPWGWEEFNRAKEAGNFGWPQFAGPNEPYRAYDYATETPGPYFDPERPINDSPNNTGAEVLPPAQSALIWYVYGMSQEFPELGAGGMSAMGGPVYRYNAETANPHAFPEMYDGGFLIYEWMRNWIYEVKFDENGDYLKIAPFLQGMAFSRPMDIEYGQDGRLYIAEWGEAFWGSNGNAQLVRIDYHGTAERPPHVQAQASTTSGTAPLNVLFDGSSSQSRNGDNRLTFAWDVRSNGSIEGTSPRLMHTFEAPGTYPVTLTVVDHLGHQNTETLEITVGNTAPVVGVEWPPNGGFFDFGETIEYAVVLHDAEDRRYEDEFVQLQVYTGFDMHELPLAAQTGRRGAFVVTQQYTHVPDLHLVDRFARVNVRYTDSGARGVRALEGETHVKLNPKRKQAEHFSINQGAQRETYGVHPAARYYGETALPVMKVNAGDHLGYAPINLANMDSVTFRVKAHAAGRIEMRLDAPDGELLARIPIDSSAGVDIGSVLHVPEEILDFNANQTHARDAAFPEGEMVENYSGWRDVTVSIRDPGGERTLYLVFEGEAGNRLFELDWMHFHGAGVHVPAAP